MIGDIRCKISEETIFFSDNPVFIIPEVGGLDPGCPILFIEVSFFFDHFQVVFDKTGIDKVALICPVIEFDPESGENVPDFIKHYGLAFLYADIQGFIFRQSV